MPQSFLVIFTAKDPYGTPAARRLTLDRDVNGLQLVLVPRRDRR